VSESLIFTLFLSFSSIFRLYFDFHSLPVTAVLYYALKATKTLIDRLNAIADSSQATAQQVSLTPDALFRHLPI